MTAPARVEDPNATAPLAALAGAKPPSPAWFEAAIACKPERSFIEVQRAKIELLKWGSVGKPGLLFLHGNSAHADWWSFIAPLFADDYRVAAISWSGMGGSDWRQGYSTETFVAEAFAGAESAGLFESAQKPIFIAHSFGGVPAISAAARSGERLRAVAIVDTPIFSPEQRKAREAKRGPRREPQDTKVYPTLEAALQRFRYIPVQRCDNLFITDFIARQSLRRAPLPNGRGEGWTWRFDPFLWNNYARVDPVDDLKNATCPVAIMWGARSVLIEDEVIDFMASIAPPGTPLVAVPEAAHHVMADQPLGLVAALRGLFAGWPR
jgi:pimeloyl-ACP methyl ester carboxylesterase